MSAQCVWLPGWNTPLRCIAHRWAIDGCTNLGVQEFVLSMDHGEMLLGIIPTDTVPVVGAIMCVINFTESTMSGRCVLLFRLASNRVSRGVVNTVMFRVQHQ